MLACDEIQVINMEWGGFWSSHLPRTYADEQLDNESVNPGQAVPIYCLEDILFCVIDLSLTAREISAPSGILRIT